MVNSMTAFGTATGAAGPLSWVWEIRSVNGRGLDVRLRLPDGYEALDRPTRKTLGAVAGRGTVNAGLKLRRAAADGAGAINPRALGAALDAAAAIRAEVESRGLETGPVDPGAVLALPGVFGHRDGEEDPTPHLPAISASLDQAVDAFAAARAAEGRALAAVISGQIDRIAALLSEARIALGDRAEAAARSLRAAVQRLLDTTDAVDEGRLAQELALLAVRSDISEELDRLDTHVTAARDLLAQSGPIGRKFDFLTQEFNREANTLCSKSGHAGLTRIGLDLKTVIDQMREQIQNVE